MVSLPAQIGLAGRTAYMAHSTEFAAIGKLENLTAVDFRVTAAEPALCRPTQSNTGNTDSEVCH